MKDERNREQELLFDLVSDLQKVNARMWNNISEIQSRLTDMENRHRMVVKKEAKDEG